MTEDGERLARLETRFDNVEREMEELERRLEKREAIQDVRHDENRTRLSGIEGTLREIGGAFKVGRWVMHAIWAVAGTALGLLFAKWAGAKP